MNKFLQNKKNLIILISFFIVLALGYLFFNSGKEVVVVPDRPDFNTRDLSRVSFFHAKDHRCTMGIPADWEGEYRMREKGNSVDFSYIINPENSPLLFSVNFYDQDKWTEIENESKIFSLEDKIFTYKLSTVNVDSVSDQEKFVKMKEDIQDIVNTLKCVKNN